MIGHQLTAPQWRLDEDDITTIAVAYGLDLLPSTARPLGGAVNGVVRISSDTGEVVLRVHRPWTTVQRLEDVHRVQEHVRAHGLPVPKVLIARNGRSWMWLHKRLVEGGRKADTWEQCPAHPGTRRRHH